MTTEPDFAAADEIAGQVVESATDDDLRGTMLYTIARAYQAARREIAEALQLTESCSSLKEMAAMCIRGAKAESDLAAARAQAERDAAVIEAAEKLLPAAFIHFSRSTTEDEHQWRSCRKCAWIWHEGVEPKHAPGCEVAALAAALAARKEPGHAV